MSGSKINAIRERLKKILAIVKSNGNEHERAMAMQRLQELLIKHRLELSDLEERAEIGVTHVTAVGRNGPWARTTASAIAQLNFCKYLWRRQGEDHTKVRHTFIGRAHEAEVACELAMLVLHQLSREARERSKYEWDSSFERSFLNGAATTIVRRAKVLKAEASRPGRYGNRSDSALIVLNQYALATEANNAYMLRAFNIAKKTNKPRIGNWKAASEGMEYGEKIPLHLSKKIAAGT